MHRMSVEDRILAKRIVSASTTECTERTTTATGHTEGGGRGERTRQARPSRFVPTLILYFPLSCGLAAWYWNRKDVE